MQTEVSDHVTLRPEPQAASLARQLASRVCDTAGVATDLKDTAVLLASEVVTNAVVHGRSEARLLVRARSTWIRIEVADDNSRLPIRQAPDPDALDGRGMALLEALAGTWGTDSAPLGKIVWFEIGA